MNRRMKRRKRNKERGSYLLRKFFHPLRRTATTLPSVRAIKNPIKGGPLRRLRQS